jgi:hypothetical protein
VDADERRLPANSTVNERDRAFPPVLSLDAENFKRTKSRRQLGAGDNPDSVTLPLARSASSLS